MSLIFCTCFYALLKLVDNPGLEPGTEACKAPVFPTIPIAHIKILATSITDHPQNCADADSFASREESIEDPLPRFQRRCIQRGQGPPMLRGFSTRARSFTEQVCAIALRSLNQHKYPARIRPSFTWVSLPAATTIVHG